jgi:hypothetical protein
MAGRGAKSLFFFSFFIKIRLAPTPPPLLPLLINVFSNREPPFHFFNFAYSDACSLVTFSGVSYCDKGEHVFIFAYDTIEEEHQNTGQSHLFLGNKYN